MPRRHFSVADVDRLIPSLERIFTEVVQLRAHLRREEERLERAGVKVTRELLEGGNGPASSPPEVRESRMRFRALYETLAETLQKVSELGGEVKDLDVGLVDFVGRRGKEDVLLCWKLGEKRVTHWHPVDAGFAARRPIDELVPQEPQPLD